MNWTSPEDIRKQIERHWNSGDLLRELIRKGNTYPLRLRLSIPKPREMATDLARAQDWVTMLRSLPGTRLEFRDIRSQALGRQEIPSALWVETPTDAISHLQMQAEAERFLAMHTLTTHSLPEITPWIEANPIRALALEASWERILRVVSWRKECPEQPQIYMRQIDLPGVDTKFVESNTTLLSELFDLVSQPEAVDGAAMDFRARHGFLREPRRIRFRILDPDLDFAGLPGCPDVELDEDSFAALRLPIHRVFVTENKTNFLTFPVVGRSIVVFGAGYGMKALGRARWMDEVPLYYWGDIDTHGFAILAQLREFFPHTGSFLMDEETLSRYQNAWTIEPVASRHATTMLSTQELALLEKLQVGAPLEGVRLEQEKISYSHVEATLAALLIAEGTQPDTSECQ